MVYTFVCLTLKPGTGKGLSIFLLIQEDQVTLRKQNLRFMERKAFSEKIAMFSILLKSLIRIEGHFPNHR